MSKLVLEKITLSNFMGSGNIEIPFNETSTLIYGDNGAGKSRIEHAFNWCLFGKNSEGVAQFHIKNMVKPEMNKVDHEVVVYAKRDGFKEVIKRIFREKTDKQGNVTGNEQVLYWNDVPLKLGEFNMKVDSLIRQDVFKMITNVNYFNGLNWSVRRDILIDIVGGHLSDDEVAKGNKEYENILVTLAEERKTLKSFSDEIKEKIKKLNNSIDEVDPKIEEILRNKPEILNWGELQKEIDEAKAKVSVIDEALQNRNATITQVNEETQKKQLDLHRLKSQLNDLKFQLEQSVKSLNNGAKSEKSNLQDALSNAESVLRSKKSVLEQKHNEIESLNSQLHDITAKWVAENKKVMPDVEDKCPTCAQLLPSGDVEAQREEIKTKWNNSLLAFKERIETEGKAINTKIKTGNESLPAIQKEVSDAEANLLTAKQALDAYVEPTAIDILALTAKKIAESKEANELSSKIADLEAVIAEPVSLDTISDEKVAELKAEKLTLQTEIDTKNKYLGTKEVIEQNETRVLELETQRKDWSNTLTELKGLEYHIKGFTRAKITALEERINEKFQYVNFKMFNQLVNGDFEDTCETVMGGRPYSALNTADKINAGLDIINTLSSHYDTYAPIFIDNRESVVKIIPVLSQTINMVVSAEDKTLRIV